MIVRTLVCVAENSPVRLCLGRQPMMELSEVSKPMLSSLSASSNTSISCDKRKGKSVIVILCRSSPLPYTLLPRRFGSFHPNETENKAVF